MDAIASSNQEPDGASNDELLDLLFKMTEDELGSDGLIRLNALLESDSLNRGVYVQYMKLIAGLEWDGASHIADVSGAKIAGAMNVALRDREPRVPTDHLQIRDLARSGLLRLREPLSKWNPLRRPLPAAVFTSLATIVFLFCVQWLYHDVTLVRSASVPALSRREADQPVAYLASSIGYSWGNDSPRLSGVGSPVNLGDEVALQEGIAEFRLSNDVYLSIEGPAGLVVNSPNSVVLQYGKVTARVPESAGNFVVLAGATRLSACGAEFGAFLTGADVEVHAFSGRVMVSNATFIQGTRGFEDHDPHEIEANLPERVGLLVEATVQQGRLLVISDDGDFVRASRWDVADNAKFASRLPMNAPLPIDDSYVAAVRSSLPAGYWRFEEIDEDVVPNDVPSDIAIEAIGNVTLVGDEQNHVVELGSTASDGILASPATLSDLSRSDYSVEVWMRPSHVHAAAIVTLAGECAASHDERPGFYLGLHGAGNAQSGNVAGGLHPGAVRFLNRDPPSGDYLTGTSCYSNSSYQLRRWQHVVATKRGSTMTLYINGDIVATGVDENSLAPDLRLVIGEASVTERTYRFRGQLDELAIYGKALTRREINEHFNAVQWHSPAVVKGDASHKASEEIF